MRRVIAWVSRGLALGVLAFVVFGPLANLALWAFAEQWSDIARIPVTEALVSRAETLAWEHGLRGYDAVQLASAALFQESLGTAVRLATFDKQLWNAAKRAGCEPWPEKAPP